MKATQWTQYHFSTSLCLQNVPLTRIFHLTGICSPWLYFGPAEEDLSEACRARWTGLAAFFFTARLPNVEQFADMLGR